MDVLVNIPEKEDMQHIPTRELVTQERQLYLAIQNNDTDKAIAILKETTPTNDAEEDTSTQGWTMLQWAAYHGNEKVTF